MEKLFQSIFGTKSNTQKQKILRLKISQLDKMIKRSIENAENALLAFNESLEFRYTFQKENNELNKILAMDINLRSMEHIEKNKDVLSQIGTILDSEGRKAPNIIRNSLKDIQHKNEKIVLTRNVKTEVMRDLIKKEDPTFVIAYEASLSRGMKADFANLLTSLKDFKDLFYQYYSFDTFNYVHEDRLNQLIKIKNRDFDLSKLIRLCDELNTAYQSESYLSVAMLVRAILDHVPPIFGHDTFAQVESNYGGKSVKKSLQNLQNSSRNIADAYLHLPIRKKESLPNQIQVDFRNDLDVLLGEIVRVTG